SRSISSTTIWPARKWKSGVSTSGRETGWPRACASARSSTSIRPPATLPKRWSVWSNPISRWVSRTRRARPRPYLGRTIPIPIGTANRFGYCSSIIRARLRSRRRRPARPPPADSRSPSGPRMLRQLSVHNIVLVERLELEFQPGLGVLTGETGAGKSILLDALGLALGPRADTALVRSGQDSAAVSAEIELAGGHPAHALLAEQGIEGEAGEA